MQKRKQRTITYEIRITVYTDFMEKFFDDIVQHTTRAWQVYEASKGRKTQIKVGRIKVS